MDLNALFEGAGVLGGQTERIWDCGMTQQVSESFKKRESLRCLFASVASMEVIDWLLEGGQLKTITANAYDIDERLD